MQVLHVPGLELPAGVGACSADWRSRGRTKTEGGALAEGRIAEARARLGRQDFGSLTPHTVAPVATLLQAFVPVPVEVCRLAVWLLFLLGVSALRAKFGLQSGDFGARRIGRSLSGRQAVLESRQQDTTEAIVCMLYLQWN